VPIVHGNDLIGFLGFDSVNAVRRWTEDIVDLLRMVGDAIGNALQRNRMEKEMMRMYRRAEKEARVNAVLLREVNHRVKNNLSEIIGLLYAQKRFSRGDYSDFIQDLTGRIRGLATVHDLLSRSGWRPLELTGLARSIVSSAIAGVPRRKRLRVSVSKSAITVNANQAHALALILNELVINSVKHALEGNDSLLIKVRMRKDRSGRVNLTYSDDGSGYPEDVIGLQRANLGLDLIRNLIVKNLQGRLTLFNDGGAAARISFGLTPPGEETDGQE
jgi:two-component sensor histidine kinase